MATNASRTIVPARQFPSGRVVNVIRKSATFDNPLFTTGIPFENALPAGSRIIDVTARVLTGFTAGATVNVGTAAAGVDIMPTADVAPAVSGYKRSLVGSALAGLANDTVPYITGGGTAAVAGSVEITILYEVG